MVASSASRNDRSEVKIVENNTCSDEIATESNPARDKKFVQEMEIVDNMIERIDTQTDLKILNDTYNAFQVNIPKDLTLCYAILFKCFRYSHSKALYNSSKILYQSLMICCIVTIITCTYCQKIYNTKRTG